MNILIHAYDGQQWRRERVTKALKIAQAILDFTDEQLDFMLHEIEDRKGDLLVHWNFRPTPRQEGAFRSAWDLSGGKNCRVITYIRSKFAFPEHLEKAMVDKQLNALGKPKTEGNV